VLAGYYVGRLPVVQQNMSVLLFLVLAVTAGTILLIIVGIIQAYRQKNKPGSQ
jgi:ABC-type uncharacterized transport system permease subunit